LQGGFGALAFGDVGDGAGHAGGLAFRVALGLAPGTQPEIFAILAPQAYFHVEGPATLQVLLHHCPDVCLVVGMDQAVERINMERQIARRVAQHFQPARGEIILAGGDVPFPQAVVDAAFRAPVTGLARAQSQDGPLAFGDVAVKGKNAGPAFHHDPPGSDFHRKYRPVFPAMIGLKG
jgi:hypothetical protein